MTIRLSSLSAVMLFAVIGAVLWMLRQGAEPSVVVINGDDADSVNLARPGTWASSPDRH